MGLVQDAQPTGTANIRIGILDRQVRESIKLQNEPIFVCIENAIETNEFEDPLNIKNQIQKELINISRDPYQRSIILTSEVTEQIIRVNIAYEIQEDSVKAKVIIKKAERTLKQSEVDGKLSDLPRLIEKISDEIEVNLRW